MGDHKGIFLAGAPLQIGSHTYTIEIAINGPRNNH
jgi:hypothetical protein